MRSWALYIAGQIFRVLPETRCFGLKRRLLRWAGAKVGRNVRVCSSVSIYGCGGLEIGDNVWIGHNSIIVCSSKVLIGANVDIAPMVFIGTGSHKIDPKGDHVAGVGVSKDITIGNGAWLGARSTVLPGVTIGDKCVVGAGSVVTKATESMKIYAGVPAKLLKDVL